jgi:hypothetical protein
MTFVNLCVQCDKLVLDETRNYCDETCLWLRIVEIRKEMEISMDRN